MSIWLNKTRDERKFFWILIRFCRMNSYGGRDLLTVGNLDQRRLASPPLIIILLVDPVLQSSCSHYGSKEGFWSLFGLFRVGKWQIFLKDVADPKDCFRFIKEQQSFHPKIIKVWPSPTSVITGVFFSCNYSVISDMKAMSGKTEENYENPFQVQFLLTTPPKKFLLQCLIPT